MQAGKTYRHKIHGACVKVLELVPTSYGTDAVSVVLKSGKCPLAYPVGKERLLDTRSNMWETP